MYSASAGCRHCSNAEAKRREKGESYLLLLFALSYCTDNLFCWFWMMLVIGVDALSAELLYEHYRSSTFIPERSSLFKSAK